LSRRIRGSTEGQNEEGKGFCSSRTRKGPIKWVTRKMRLRGEEKGFKKEVLREKGERSIKSGKRTKALDGGLLRGEGDVETGRDRKGERNSQGFEDRQQRGTRRTGGVENRSKKTAGKDS